MPVEQDSYHVASREPLPEAQSVRLQYIPTCEWGHLGKIKLTVDLIAGCAIIAAAKQGQLRRLSLTGASDRTPWKPFAIPSLLPYWVSIGFNLSGSWVPFGWVAAAASLRPALSHMSLTRLIRARNGSRTLTCKDVQSMTFEFPKIPLPSMPPVLWERPLSDRLLEHNLNRIHRYATWLHEDAELAQRVADAWNAVVGRGEADDFKCYCKECKLHSI